MTSKACSFKTMRFSTFTTGMLPLGALSCSVRSLTTLRSPCCEEAQATGRGHMEAFYPTSLDEPSLGDIPAQAGPRPMKAGASRAFGTKPSGFSQLRPQVQWSRDKPTLRGPLLFLPHRIQETNKISRRVGQNLVSSLHHNNPG